MKPTSEPREQKTRHGRNVIGNPYRSSDGASRNWFRDDTYISDDDGKETIERRFAAGPNDQSDMAIHPYGENAGNIRYSSNCSCCFLGFSHTIEAHNQRC